MDETKLKQEIAKQLKRNPTDLTIGFENINDENTKVIAETLVSNPNIQIINLGNNGIGPDGAIIIADAVKNHPGIKQVNLSGNKLGPDGAKAIAGAVKINSSIEQVDLTFNEIGPDGAKAIAGAVKNHPSIKQIKLICNKIGPDGAKAIAGALESNTSIKVIDLTNNKIGPDGIKYIANALKINTSIQFLKLANNSIGSDEAKVIVGALEKNYIITKLITNLLTENSIREIDEIIKRNINLVKVFAKKLSKLEGTEKLFWQQQLYLEKCDKAILEQELAKRKVDDIKGLIKKSLASKISYVEELLTESRISKTLTKETGNNEVWLGSMPAEILKIIFCQAYPGLAVYLDKSFGFRPAEKADTEQVEPSGIAEVYEEQV